MTLGILFTNARLFIILFVRSFGRVLFAILAEFSQFFEVLLIEILEEIYHFAGWEGRGVKGRENWEQ